MVETGEMEENSEDDSTSYNDASQDSMQTSTSNISSQDPSQGESKDNREKAEGNSFHCSHCNSINDWSMFQRHRIRYRMVDTVPSFPTDPMTYPNLPVSPELGNIYREHWGSIRSHYFHRRI